jgi:hypothetical protein
MNNAGNLRGKDGNFRKFATPEEGYKALVGDITAKVSGNSKAMKAKYGKDYTPTLNSLISVYAPPTENNTQNYVDFVAKRTGIDPNQALTTADVNKIVPHMVEMEHGAKGAEKYKQYADSGQIMSDAQPESAPQTFNVRLPDGRVLQNIPMGTTKEQVAAKLASKGIKFDEPQQVQQTAPQPAPPAQPQEPGYMERVGADIQQAGKKTGEILSNPNMNPAAAGIQILGQGANIATAPVVEAVRSGINALPTAITEPIGNAVSSVSDSVKNAYQSGINSLSETGAGKAVGDYLMNSPRLQSGLNELSDTAKAAGTIATVLPAGKAATSVAAPLAKKTGQKIASTKLAQDVSSGVEKAAKIAPLAADDIKTAATNAYKTATNAGGVFKSSFTDKMIAALDESKPKPIAGKVLTSQDKALFNSLDEYTPLKGRALTLDDIQRIDETLSDKIDSLLDAGRVTKPAKKIIDAQQKLRDMVDNAQASDIHGGKQGFEALAEARSLWSAQAKMRDLEKIVSRAEMMDNPATGIKTGFRNLALNDKKIRGYPAEVRGLIKKAAETGVVGDLLGIAGSRLNAIVGGAVGGVKGSIVANATSMAARDARTKLQVGKAQKVSDAVADQVRPLIEKYKTPLASLDVPNKPTLASSGKGIVALKTKKPQKPKLPLINKESK